MNKGVVFTLGFALGGVLVWAWFRYISTATKLGRQLLSQARSVLGSAASDRRKAGAEIQLARQHIAKLTSR